ncbi:MAG: deoxynucleoside kinase [Candidatus Micrarchaeota archaeon]|nr:deoxynucleoside kinase [Candidatus Micrarchaeota archaeon]
MMIAIEGVDAVGKTTLSNLLKEKLRAENAATSNPEILPSLKKIFDEQAKSAVVGRLMYYLFQVQNEVSKLNTKSSKSIIFDRYIYSTIVTHTVLDRMYNKGKNIGIITQIREEALKTFRMPEIILFLYADERVRKLRLQKRDSKLNGVLDKNTDFAGASQQEFKLMAKELKKLGKSRVKEIDTTSIGKLQVFAKVCKVLEIERKVEKPKIRFC